MKIFHKVAVVGALVQAVMIGTLLVFLLKVLPSIGVTPNDLHNPDKILPAIHSPLLSAYYALFFTFGFTLLILAFWMSRRLQAQPRGLTRLFRVTSLIGAAGYTSYAVIGSLMISNFNNLAQSNPSAAKDGVITALALLSTALTIAGFDAVTTTALWGWATLRAGVLPKYLCYLIITASLARYVTLVVPIPLFILFNLGGSVAWSVWLSVVLLSKQRDGSRIGISVPATS